MTRGIPTGSKLVREHDMKGRFTGDLVDPTTVKVMHNHGMPTRCGFTWQEKNGSGWVRCLNTNGTSHGAEHAHVRESVRVGNEATVTGFWVGESGE